MRNCDDELVFTTCDARARCTRGYCVCGLGMKGERLEGVTVYADVGEVCDERCEDLSCREVGRLEEGVCWKSGGDEWDGEGYGEDGLEGVTYENVGGGQAD